jgi:hypothetical protein
MAYYTKTSPRTMNLVSRQGYSNLDGVLDDVFSSVKGAVGSVINFYGTAQQNAGAAALAQQQAAQQQAQMMPGAGGGGISTGTMLALGAGALGLVLLLRK